MSTLKKFRGALHGTTPELRPYILKTDDFTAEAGEPYAVGRKSVAAVMPTAAFARLLARGTTWNQATLIQILEADTLAIEQDDASGLGIYVNVGVTTWADVVAEVENNGSGITLLELDGDFGSELAGDNGGTLSGGSEATFAGITATLPADPSEGQVVDFADTNGTWDESPLTLTANRLIEGQESNFVNNAAGTFFRALFVGGDTGWRILTSGTQPLNITVPVLSGDYSFSATTGTWTGSPTSYAYQWQISDDGETGWTNITDEAASSYLAVEADEGKFVRCGVIASNANGPSARVFTAASAAIVVPDFPTTGMIAFWKLADLADASGNANTLTNNNAVTFAAGKVGNAAVFDGSNDLSSGADIPEGDFTISAWVNCTQETGQSEVVGNFAGGAALFQNSTSIYYANDGGASIQLNGPTIVDAGWVHCLVTRSGNLFTLYIDGTSYTTQSGGASSNCDNVAIGKNFYHGKVDAVGIWSRALTAPEIALVYNAGAGLEP